MHPGQPVTCRFESCLRLIIVFDWMPVLELWSYYSRLDIRWIKTIPGKTHMHIININNSWSAAYCMSAHSNRSNEQRTIALTYWTGSREINSIQVEMKTQLTHLQISLNSLFSFSLQCNMCLHTEKTLIITAFKCISFNVIDNNFTYCKPQVIYL